MYNLDKGQKIDIELEKYVAPVPKKSMTMKERIDKAKTKLSEKKPQETELKNDKLSNNKIKVQKIKHVMMILKFSPLKILMSKQ
ncbi:hypothetical protein [Lactococcus lactis]|uniref:hypothetical protein n=1 Tax=Lactococcus lactis TaxID=1358 RepID=UPI00205DC3D8|nr:hypothetical protein [Lactococcus lactis]UPS11466.1 hypothetical protein JRY11_002518 [Lactococcus lactis]